MAAKKKNVTDYDSLRQRTQDRDVYMEQQVGRSRIHEKFSKRPRQIFVAVIAVLIFLATYFGVGLIQFGYYAANQAVSTQTQESTSSSGLLSFSAWCDQNGFTEATLGEEYDYAQGFWKGSDFNDHEEFTQEQVEGLYNEYAQAYLAEHPEEREQVLAESAEPAIDYVSFFMPDFLKIIIALFVSGVVASVLYQTLMRQLDAQNLMNTTDDINQYPNDQHIAYPQELQDRFDWFPDVGAHCDVQVTSLISHMMLTNKGLGKIAVPERAKKDVLDSDGDIAVYKGEVLYSDDGETPIYKQMPMIDEAFGDYIFDASNVPKKFRIKYNPSDIDYNPEDKNREKLKGFPKLSDMIGATWSMPLYEPQRPAGAYLVDTSPSNTMV